jgi:hypothetical protein
LLEHSGNSCLSSARLIGPVLLPLMHHCVAVCVCDCRLQGAAAAVLGCC